MLPDGTPLSVRVVDRSLIALQELQVAVGEGRHALRAAGADVSSVSVHVASNRVEVGLADYTEQAAEVVMSAFPGVDVYAGSHSEPSRQRVPSDQAAMPSNRPGLKERSSDSATIIHSWPPCWPPATMSGRDDGAWR